MSEEVPAVKQAKSRLGRMLGIAVWIWLLIYFGAATGLITLVEVPLRLMFGWAIHGFVMFPGFLAQWPKALLPLACLALALWLAHRFTRWWISARGTSVDWKSVHTVAVTALLLLGSAAAIAMSGIVHQVAWLGGQPWFEEGPGAMRKTIAISNAKQLILGLEDHVEAHGCYPGSLEQLEIEPLSLQKLMWVETGSHRMQEPFLLLRPGAAKAEVGAEPLIVSPVVDGKNGFVVGFADGHVKWFPAEQLGRILATPGHSTAHE